MAVLNIKGFPDELYERLREQAKKEHRSISQQVTHLLEDAISERAVSERIGQKPKRRSITELRGLGARIWKGIDAAEYVKKERDSWDS